MDWSKPSHEISGMILDIHLKARVGLIVTTVMTSLRTFVFHVNRPVAAAVAVVEEVIIVNRPRIGTIFIDGL
jgi:hypothetical protein